MDLHKNGEPEETMRFLRSTPLQRILPFLLLVLLGASSFGFIEPPGDGKHDLVIHSPQFLPELCGSLQKHQIPYCLDATKPKTIKMITWIVSEIYCPETSCDPFSIIFQPNPNRGPPRPIPIV